MSGPAHAREVPRERKLWLGGWRGLQACWCAGVGPHAFLGALTARADDSSPSTRTQRSPAPCPRSQAVPAPADVQVAGVWQRWVAGCPHSSTQQSGGQGREGATGHALTRLHRRQQAFASGPGFLPEARVLLHHGRGHLCALPVLQGGCCERKSARADAADAVHSRQEGG